MIVFCPDVFRNAAVQFIKAEVCMTCPAKSIKDVHNITSFYLLICAHKGVTFIPFNIVLFPFSLLFCIYFKSFYPMLHLLFFWFLLSVSVGVWLI